MGSGGQSFGKSGRRGQSAGGSSISGQINSLKPLNDDANEVINPIPYSGENLSSRLQRLYGDLDADVKPEVQNVLVNGLKSVQDWVYKDRLKAIDKKYANMDDIVSGKNTGIVVLNYRGQNYVLDGNHRASIAMMRGVNVLRHACIIYDLI